MLCYSGWIYPLINPSIHILLTCFKRWSSGRRVGAINSSLVCSYHWVPYTNRRVTIYHIVRGKVQKNVHHSMLSLPRRLETACQQHTALSDTQVWRGCPLLSLAGPAPPARAPSPRASCLQHCASALAGGLWLPAHHLLRQERARPARQISVQTPCLHWRPPNCQECWVRARVGATQASIYLTLLLLRSLTLQWQTFLKENDSHLNFVSQNLAVMGFVIFLFSCSDHTTWLMGSLFPDQGLNPRHIAVKAQNPNH